ncbi:18199_t:CDS:2, partial [Gigaspora margarita]
IFEETYKKNIQLQTDLSSLQFQYLDQKNINLSSLDNSEVLEISENNLLKNEIWTEEEITKFKMLYQKTKDILEKQDDDNQKLEDEITLLQNNEFKRSFDKGCCEKNCLQNQCDYSIALLRHLNFKNLSKSFQDMYLLGKPICLNAFKIIYSLEEKRYKNLREHFTKNDINLRKNCKIEKIGNRAMSFETVLNVITFIANYAKQNGLPSP